jgi:siroheme synthase (precorrin-2 oxidase/ferrochelatase)
MVKYPEVQGGGSLMLAWQVRNRNVLVIGGGEVSSIKQLLQYLSQVQILMKDRSPLDAFSMSSTPMPK